MGRDEAGRRQYIYHPRWRAISSATKFDRLHLIADVLPRMRRRVRRDLNREQLDRHRVLAAVMRLIDKGNIRVGNQRYTEEHGSRGATTLTPDHVEVEGFRISLDFPGKSGQRREVEFSDSKTAEVINQCEDIDGQHLFCYQDADGDNRVIESTDVNEYLRDITGQTVTAKDFRTWSGSVIVLAALATAPEEENAASRKKKVNAAIEAAAAALGNTKTVCRNSYVHPGILAAGESGELASLLTSASTVAARRKLSELTNDERLFAAVLPLLSA